MSINPDHQQKSNSYVDHEGNPLPPFEVRSPQPDFGDDAQGKRIREANRAAEKAKKSRRNKIIASVAGTALAVGAAVVGYDAVKDDSEDQRPTTSDVNKKEVKAPWEIEASLSEIKRKTKPEQIEYIINNPVTVAKFSTPEKQIEALGARFNGILNSGTVNLDADIDPDGYYPLTEKSQEQFDKMIRTIYDEDSTGFDSLYSAMLSTTKNLTLGLDMGEDWNTKFEAGNDFRKLDDGTHIIATSTSYSRSEDTTDSITVEFTLVEKDGVVRIAHTHEIK